MNFYESIGAGRAIIPPHVMTEHTEFTSQITPTVLVLGKPNAPPSNSMIALERLLGNHIDSIRVQLMPNFEEMMGHLQYTSNPRAIGFGFCPTFNSHTDFITRSTRTQGGVPVGFLDSILATETGVYKHSLNYGIFHSIHDEKRSSTLVAHPETYNQIKAAGLLEEISQKYNIGGEPELTIISTNGIERIEAGEKQLVTIASLDTDTLLTPELSIDKLLGSRIETHFRFVSRGLNRASGPSAAPGENLMFNYQVLEALRLEQIVNNARKDAEAEFTIWDEDLVAELDEIKRQKNIA